MLFGNLFDHSWLLCILAEVFRACLVLYTINRNILCVCVNKETSFFTADWWFTTEKTAKSLTSFTNHILRKFSKICKGSAFRVYRVCILLWSYRRGKEDEKKWVNTWINLKREKNNCIQKPWDICYIQVHIYVGTRGMLFFIQSVIGYLLLKRKFHGKRSSPVRGDWRSYWDLRIWGQGSVLKLHTRSQDLSTHLTGAAEQLSRACPSANLAQNWRRVHWVERVAMVLWALLRWGKTEYHTKRI